MEEQFTPFGKIGLCFSGGGYRATFFALGVISYLSKVNYQDESLLSHVEALSSVSGGTLLAVAYAKAEQDPDFDFDKFFNRFYDHFCNEGKTEEEKNVLLNTAVDKLEDPKLWSRKQSKRRSLINAFALTYAEMDIYNGTFDVFKDTTKSRLKHVCFNATDFSYGLAFRFQNSGLFGNKALSCKEVENITDKIPLGDIVASSSCFPFGFEPLLFPDDYIQDHQDKDYKKLKILPRFHDGVGIMDGGIVDNQGIGSMMNIHKRDPLDLIIVNDVGSYKMDPWEPTPTEKRRSKNINSLLSGILSKTGVKWSYILVLMLGILMIPVSYLDTIPSSFQGFLLVLSGVVITLGLGATIWGVASAWIKGDIESSVTRIFNKNVPKVLIDDVLSFDKLDLSLVKRMLLERASSAEKMVSSVFLKQIRRLNYDLFYSKSNLQNRRITSTVYELNGEKSQYKYHDKLYENIPEAKEKLKQVSMIASKTPTTLWWDAEDEKVDRMNCLIADGQFTTCYNLMEYIVQLKKQNIESEALNALFKQLKKDWKAFNDDPTYLVDAYRSAKG